MRRHLQSYMFCSIILVLTLCAQANAAADAGNPRQCLAQISQAIENADGESFTQLVNIDSILADSLNTFIDEAQKPENAQNMPPMVAMLLGQLSSSGKSAEALRTLLLNEAKNFVLNGVNSGAFAGRQPDTQKMTGLLSPLLANASTGRKEIHSISDPMPAGDAWLVSFMVHDHGNGQDYPVAGRFLKSDGRCILDGIVNMPQIFAQIQRESQIR